MAEKLAKLCSLAGDAEGPALGFHDGNLSPVLEELKELLVVKNGFYAFESALHVFPFGGEGGGMTLEVWNAGDVWREGYPWLDSRSVFFAEDAFGEQFLIRDGRIAKFDPETGQSEDFANGLEEWAGRVLDDFEYVTGYSLAHTWQQAHGPLPRGKRLLPKVPFVAGGEYAVDNLYVGDSVEGMRFRAELARQIVDLPDGAKIKFEIVE